MINNLRIGQRLKAVAENIRHERLEKNYSQEYMACKLGISQNAYSKIELGYTKVSLKRVFDIAVILEVDVLSIFRFDADKHLKRYN